MAMVASDLATQLKAGLGFSGNPMTGQVSGMATAIIAEFAAASVANASGTVLGTAPPTGGPLTAGSAAGGTISGMSGSDLASKMKSDSGFPSVSPQLLNFCTAMVTHFLTGVVSFASGNINGTCTNTAGPPPIPGILSAGVGTGGLISGYSGSTLASQLATALGQSDPTPLLNFSTNLVTYVMANAIVSYATGSVTATISAGGGPIVGGAGAGGTIA